MSRYALLHTTNLSFRPGDLATREGERKQMGNASHCIPDNHQNVLRVLLLPQSVQVGELEHMHTCADECMCRCVAQSMCLVSVAMQVGNRSGRIPVMSLPHGIDHRVTKWAWKMKWSIEWQRQVGNVFLRLCLPPRVTTLHLNLVLLVHLSSITAACLHTLS